MKKQINTYILIAIGCIAIGNTVSAQEGKELFQNMCSVCHKIDDNSTGPKLQGARQLWVDAGEQNFLYDWVKNAQELTENGKSKRAIEASEYSPIIMTPQNVTNEQIDAVFDYIDNWKPEVIATNPAVTTTKNEEAQPIMIQNYIKNQRIFYWLIATMIALLIAIKVMASSIKSFLKTDYFKTGVKDNFEKTKQNASGNNVKNLLTIALILGASTIPAHTFAQSMDIGADDVLFKLTSTDLYIIGFINIILLFVLFYQVRLFKSLFKMSLPQEEVATIESEGFTTKKLNKLLTDIVDIKDEASILMDHEYDGIQELDNNLPPWWVWGFYATIVFAVIYLLNYHVFKTSELQVAEYETEVSAAEIQIAAYRSKMSMNIDEFNVTLLTDETALNEGKALYLKNCQSCHLENGSGSIGPNLTDNYWMYGNDIASVFKTIKYGAPNGMPDHEKKMNPIELQQVASFVLSLKYAEGKDPEGELVAGGESTEILTDTALEE
jgi:cytochrome c oxidase cbb3-type subunit III